MASSACAGGAVLRFRKLADSRSAQIAGFWDLFPTLWNRYRSELYGRVSYLGKGWRADTPATVRECVLCKEAK